MSDSIKVLTSDEAIAYNPRPDLKLEKTASDIMALGKCGFQIFVTYSHGGMMAGPSELRLQKVTERGIIDFVIVRVPDGPDEGFYLKDAAYLGGATLADFVKTIFGAARDALNPFIVDTRLAVKKASATAKASKMAEAPKTVEAPAPVVPKKLVEEQRVVELVKPVEPQKSIEPDWNDDEAWGKFS